MQQELPSDPSLHPPPPASSSLSSVCRTARCVCGGFRVNVRGDPARVSICHCFACQQRTGSVFGCQSRFPEADVTFEGESKTYVRVGDAGGIISYRFCPTCGTSVTWTIDQMPGNIIVAIGCFSDPTCFPAPTFSVYEARAFPWALACVAAECAVHWD